MPKQNLTISRYADAHLGWESCVRPDSGAWVLFIPRTEAADMPKAPQLWLRAGSFKDESGDTRDCYVKDGATPQDVAAYLDDYGHGIGLVQHAE